MPFGFLMVSFVAREFLVVCFVVFFNWLVMTFEILMIIAFCRS